MTPRTVLYIDDDEFQLEFVADALRDLGLTEVLTASGGRAGLALYDGLERKPDLVLCDLSMPGMDGVEFLRHLAERGYAGGIGVLSGMEPGLLKAAEALARAYCLNLLGTIGKPVRREDLLAILSRVDQMQPGRAIQPVEASLSAEEVGTGLSNGRIEVYFQPKVMTSERRMSGVECLARWRHPERGLLGPHTFIAVAEQHGLIDELTLAVLRRAISHAADWRRSGHDFKISVNLSTDNLNRLDLPEIIHQIVLDAGLESQQIVLEITESAAIHDLRLSLDILTRLRLKGFGLSIDDFGTGYASMETLKQLPFSELKVDRAFVFGATHDSTARTILESSVRLARALGLNLVAEGVETQEEWDLVTKLDCDEVQGYFIAKPMSGDKLLAWKNEWECDVNTDDLPAILLVDDESMLRGVACDSLGQAFRMLSAESGLECLTLLETHKADLVLLDVEMPGIDGYETCRRIRGNDNLADIPVIFLSGHDAIEDRLMGYEAGGDDYVVKPFEPMELTNKITNLLRLYRERKQHKEMASFAGRTAMTAMTSMGELGGLIETMKRFNACNTLSALVDATLAGLALYDLRGAVQIRSSDQTLTRTEVGDAPPLVISIIKHMATADRISFFKSRLCITYEYASLLVSNMPVDDEERYGRLRDHLAMLAEAANVRAQAIMLGGALGGVVESLARTLVDIDEAQRQCRAATNLSVNALNEDIAKAFLSMGLTERQEEYLGQLIRKGIDRILDAESTSFDIQDRMSSLIRGLNEIGAAKPN